MSNLDLDINHYQISDLEVFFRLQLPYNEHDISKKENEIRTLLLSSGQIEPHFKRDLIMFLAEGKSLLIKHKTIAKRPTTIGKPILEETIPSNYPIPNMQLPSRAENVILPKTTEFSYHQTSEFFPGQLNPLDTRILQKCVSIDSRFCQSSSHSDFIISLPNKIQNAVSMECKSMAILSQNLINITQSFGNNYIYVSITAKEGEFNKVFVIPDGYYDTDLLLETLNRICGEQKNTPFLFLDWKKDPFGSNKCVLMVNNKEDTYYLEKIKHVSLDFRVNINGEADPLQDSFTRMGYLLGFTMKTYTGKMSYMGEIPVNTSSSIPYFYLSIDDYQNRSVACFQPAFSQITSSPANLARIALNHITNETHIVSTPRKYFGPVDINRLQVRLLDPHGKVLSLNANFSFCLLFNTVYDL